jgi:hypothetical protein
MGSTDWEGARGRALIAAQIDAGPNQDRPAHGEVWAGRFVFRHICIGWSGNSNEAEVAEHLQLKPSTIYELTRS